MSQIGHYDILEKLGEGGMGVVYRARDSKLGREVALKVLPPEVADNADRLARLQREAQILASLNHPNVAHIYGIEDRALVMEYVPGEDLRGPVPVTTAMDIATQIASALDAAHEKGIVHRDLKPANIRITPEGRVKVLDFGLARAFMVEASSTVTNAPPGGPPSDLERTPAVDAGSPADYISTLKMNTRTGSVLGRVAYMSPEQARGKEVDKRTDIWAFGCVLYELLTGKKAFSGGTATDVIAAILANEPDWNALPPGSPVDLLQRCLQKDAKLRLRDIGDADLSAAPIALPVRQSASSGLPWAITAGSTLVAIVALALLWRGTRPKPTSPLQRLTLDLGADAGTSSGFGAAAILSADGRRLVFAGRGDDGKTRLHTRMLDQPKVQPLAGTESLRNPFFSPDGQWVAFFADAKLKKISVQGGAAITLCSAPEDRGGSWGDDDRIFFAGDTRSGLLQVSSAGGLPKPVTELQRDKGEATHRWPQVLPGAEAILFTASATLSNYDEASIEVQSLKTGERKTLQRGGAYGRYLPSGAKPGNGHLVYVHQGTLYAAPMDLKRLEVTGPATAVLEEVVSNNGNGGAQFAFADTGVAVFRTGKVAGGARTIVWLDSSGKTQPLRAVPGRYSNPRFSPDGKRLAFASAEGANVDVWVYEWERDMISRLTIDPELDSYPAWSPDGQHIAFESRRGGGPGSIYWVRADGGGETVRLTSSRGVQYPYSFSPDGKLLAYAEQSPESSWDIWVLPLDITDPDHPKPGNPELFLRTPFRESTPAFSPDGRWMAYTSTEAGVPDVYVRPYVGPAGKWQISTGGGTMPVWSRNGRELFYRTPDGRIMVTTYTAKSSTFSAGKPLLWSQTRAVDDGGFPNFDLAPDGRRLAILQGPEGEGEQRNQTHAVFLLNFFDELRRRALPGTK